MKNRIVKALSSLFSGVMAIAETKDNAEIGVKVEIPIKDRFMKTTPFCAHCLKEFPPHKGGVLCLPDDANSVIMQHIQQCPQNPLVKKMKAADDKAELLGTFIDDLVSITKEPGVIHSKVVIRATALAGDYRALEARQEAKK